MAPDRRNLILDAAIGVIARKGVRGLRVEVVAAEAGVAVSLIYYYFGSRKGLVRRDARPRQRARRAGGARRACARRCWPSSTSPRARPRPCWGEIQASAIFEPALQEQVREATETWVSVVAAAIAAEAPVADPRARRRASHRAGRRALVALALRGPVAGAGGRVAHGGDRGRARFVGACLNGPRGPFRARPRLPPVQRAPDGLERRGRRSDLRAIHVAQRLVQHRTRAPPAVAPAPPSPAGDSVISDTRASSGSRRAGHEPLAAPGPSAAA